MNTNAQPVAPSLFGMRSPLVALSWEIWRRGQWFAVGALGLLGLCAVLNLSGAGRAYVFTNFEPFYWLLMICSIFLVFGFLHYAEFNQKKNWHGFPYRLFTLPVPTWMLVACPMVLGVVCVELIYFGWARLVFAPAGRHAGFWPAAVLGVGLMCYQTIVWALGGFRMTRIITLALAGMLFMNLASLQFFLPYIPWPARQVWCASILALTGTAIGAFVCGCHFVERQRRGGGRGRGWLKTQVGRITDVLPRRTRPFDSPAAAQFWFEWRRAGMLLPVCTVAALVLLFAPVSWLTRHDAGATLLTLGWALVLPLILAGVIGKGFAKPDLWSPDLALPPFLAVRPLTSEEMVVTKLKVAALSITMAWLALLVFLALWLPLWANLAQLKDLWNSGLALRGVASLGAILFLLVVTATLLTWTLVVSNLWVALSGNKRWFVVHGILGTAILGIEISAIVFWVKHFNWKYAEQYVSGLGWALVLAVVSKLWLAVFTWRRNSPNRALQYVIFWACASGCFVALGLLVCPNLFWLKHLVILAALLPVPLARLGLAPLSLEKNRRR